MALWGSVESVANTPIFATALVNKVANSANRTALYGNNSFGISGETVITGLFGLDATEEQRSNSSVIMGLVSFQGSGYLANTATATASAPPNAGAIATANGVTNIAVANGRITAVNIVVNGDKYIAKPTIALAAPAAQTFNASSGGAITANFVALAPNPFQRGDKVRYLVPDANTALPLLANATFYTVSLANSTGIKISNLGAGNPDIAIVGTGTTQTHSFTGETATIELVLSHNSTVGAHTGWVTRKVFSGGRAGRVQYETLVAMSSLSGASTPAANTTTPIKSS